MPNQKLRKLVDAHKPKAFYKPTQIKQFGERERLEIEGAEIYVRHFEWIISSSGVDFDNEYMDPETTLPQFAIDAENGVPIQINHDYQPLNCGRSTSGSFNREKEIVTAGGYIQEGLTDVDSDSVIARLLAGTSPEASVGFDGETVCSFDGTPMHWFWGDCEYGHSRGQKILVDGDGNETVDVEEAVETVDILGKIINGRLLEFSPVWRACNQDAQLIRSVRSLYKSGDIGDTEVKSLSKRMRYDFKSILGRKSRIFLPKQPKRRRHVSDEKITTEEFNETLEELQEAQFEIKSLKAELATRPETEKVDEKIKELNTELEQKDAEIVDLNTRLKTANEAAEDLEFGLKLLRQDVLDAYADEQELTKWGRDNDEGYSDLKKSLEKVESVGALIRRRKRYSSEPTGIGDRKTTRRSHVTGHSEYEGEGEKEVPVPGTPGAEAYAE